VKAFDQTTVAASGPSVASSSCLTSRKIHTTSDAASIISDAIRNAWVAPSVNVAWKNAASRKFAPFSVPGSTPAAPAAWASVGPIEATR